jgi:MoxR-like ATPase
MEAYRDSFEHIREEMLRIDLMLRRAVTLARGAAEPEAAKNYRGMVISEGEIDDLLGGEDFMGAQWRREALRQDTVRPFDKAIADVRAKIDQRRSASEQAGVHLALAHLALQFGLSEAEVDLLLIGLAPELEPHYETLFAYLQDDVTRKRPSINLALNLICRGEREKLFARRMFSAGAPLIHFQLLQLEDEAQDRDPIFLRKFLKLPDTVRRYLLDEPMMAAPRATDATQHEAALQEISDDSRTAIEAVIEAILRGGLTQAFVRLRGNDETALNAAVEILAAALNRGVVRFEVSPTAGDSAAVVRAIRDSALFNGLLAIWSRTSAAQPDATKSNAAEAQLWPELARIQDPVVLAGSPTSFSTPPPELAMRVWTLDVAPPGFPSRRDSWQQAIAAAGANGDPDVLADSFYFGRLRIRQAVDLASSQAALRDPNHPVPNQADLAAAARSLATPNLGRYAVAITPKATWGDLILPPDKKAQLLAFANRTRYRRRVHDEWGFAEKMSRGKGNSALLTGPPGTGKTMAAEALANHLGLALMQIDISQVVSRYVGEAEFNLSVIFREAEHTQTLLFFDEADSLFGKRFETKDAHDHYANLEVNYLLQRIEQYEGTVVLASNFQKNIDEAFLRRMQEVIEFPVPDETQREAIWRKHFPKAAPLAPDVDIPFLAKQFKLTGGNIKNIVFTAAFAAAEDNGAIGMSHLVAALRTEMLKQGRIVMKSELGKFFDLSLPGTRERPAKTA